MNDIIKCVAIDDEPLALDIIDKFCQRIGNIELKKYSNPTEGLNAVLHSHPDIVFLDIASQLPEDTCFIFTTAYMRYALDGFNLDAVDYLHKPFAYSRFQAAFAKALRRIGRDQVKTASQHIVVKQDYNNISIPIEDILYIEAVEGYSKIFRLSGECVISRILLKNIFGMLPSNVFVRIHRSFIVSKTKIKSFNKQEVVLVDGTALPVGRQYASELLDTLKQ